MTQPLQPAGMTEFRIGDVLRTPAEVAEYLRGGAAQFSDAPTLQHLMRGAADVLDAQRVELELMERDAARLDWLLPNLHPANFGLGYDPERLESDYCAEFRAAIDAALSSAKEQQP